MRFLRFLGRWYLIFTAAAAIVLWPNPRPIAWVLLGVVIAGNIWHRHKLAELRRQQRGGMPFAYPVPWPVPWYPPPGWTPPAPPAPGAEVDAPATGSDELLVLPPGESEGRPGSSVARVVALGLVGLVAMLGFSLARPATAFAAAPAVSSAPAVMAARAPGIGLPNPYDWLFEQALGNPFRSGMQKTLKTALDSSEASFLTPRLDTQARVEQIWGLLLEIADSLLLLLIVVGAVMVVAGDWTYLEAKALAPRVVVAGVVMNLSLLILGQATAWSNDLGKGFLALGDSSFTPAVSNIVGAVRTPLMLAVLLVVALFLLFVNLLRLVVVLVLAVGGPLLNVFGVLPASEGIARAWWRALAACLIAPAVQALLLVLAVWITSTGATPFVVLFANPAWTNIVDGTLLVVLIALMAISPLWMLKRALGEGHGHLVAAFRWSRRAAGAIA